MAMYVNMRLGFVFELDESMKVDQNIVEFRKCENKKACGNNKNQPLEVNFCPECGSKVVKEKHIDEPNFLSCYDFCETYLDGKEIVCTDNGGLPDNIWLYNYKLADPDLEKLCHDGDFADQKTFIDLSQIDINSAIEKFKKNKNVKLVLDTFEKVYGKNKIRVKYGYFSTVF